MTPGLADLHDADADVLRRKAELLGASFMEDHSIGDFHWHVMQDPEGNEFCIAQDEVRVPRADFCPLCPKKSNRPTPQCCIVGRLPGVRKVPDQFQSVAIAMFTKARPPTP
ncbi:VOC family protein [Arthrobacter sp. YN]|uniref:VOC family protein n=1 Tax=Arthrobacter sp. YN TaxID=2020486 RepID=UPI001E39D7F3|nr:VOC family protein [Arthrobacter sp. YN]